MSQIKDLTQIPPELYDKRYIAESLYQKNAKLYREKVKLHRSLSSRSSLIDWYIKKIKINNSLIIDVGCGHGNFLLPIAEKIKELKDSSYILGADISQACVNLANTQLHSQKLPGKVFLGDMDNLDLPSMLFDKILCNFVLYHAENIAATIDEIVRITNPRGTIFIITNSRETMKEFEEISSRALSLTLGKDIPLASRLESRFCEENATEFFKNKLQLRNKYIFKDSMVFNEAKGFVAYYNITKRRYLRVLGSEVYRKLLKNVEKLVSEEIKMNGKVVINKRSCLFVLKRLA